VPIDTAILPPAPGQGALALETRTADGELRELVAVVHDPGAGAAVAAERRAMAALAGGCRLPVAALGSVGANGRLWLHVAVAAADGSASLRAEGTGDPARPDELGDRLARELLAAGADRLMNTVTTA
jgi:hydroxymethylbilane synthase